MSIVKMKRFRLIGLQSDRDVFLRELQHLGCVEIDPPDAGTDDPAWSALAPPDGERLSQARETRTMLETALEGLKKFSPEKGGLLDPLPSVREAELFHDGAYVRALDTGKQIGADLERYYTVKAEIPKLEAQRAALAPWMELDVPLDVSSTRETSVLLASVNSGADWNEVLGAAASASELAELTKAGRDKENQYFLLVCHKSVEEDVIGALKPCGFGTAALRGWTGTAAENDRQISSQLSRLRRELEEQERKLSGYGKERAALRLALDRTAQEIGQGENQQKLLQTGSTYLLTGWFPAEDQGRMEKVLSRYSCAWEVSDPTEEEYPKVPVKLKNGPLSRPMNMVTEMYSLPAYDGLDPNPLMAPFFILFYGIMMADMAYGILMMAASVIVLSKKKPRGTMNYMFSLMGLCGITTFLMGALTGGFLGDYIPQVLKIMNPESTFEMPALFTPLNDTLAILIGSLVLGFIQVITGMIISFVKQTKDGHFLDALFNEGTWWVIFVGAGLAILGIGSVGGVPIVLGLGLLMLVIGTWRQNPGIGVITGLVGAIYNGVTGIFQDVLSYSRLMALMLSGSIIASVFNTLGSITGNVIAFTIISLIGNALNFTLNILGCFVHDLRLQCLEFFGRFYKDGGRPFKPLTINTKYVDIIKEEQ